MGRLERPAHRRGRRGRGFESRPLRKRFLIVCEGEVTEVRYFQAFPVAKDIHVRVEGEGSNTLSLVEAAERYADEPGARFDEVWVVYDHDDFPDERFNAAEAAIRSEDAVRSERWRAAWSHQAYEVWYLLHFQHFDSRLHRHLVQRKVGEHLASRFARKGYRKNDPDLYKLLLPLQAEAIQHAERLCKTHGVAPHGDATPSRANPCTTVHRLVQALNAEIR